MKENRGTLKVIQVTKGEHNDYLLSVKVWRRGVPIRVRHQGISPDRAYLLTLKIIRERGIGRARFWPIFSPDFGWEARFGTEDIS